MTKEITLEERYADPKYNDLIERIKDINALVIKGTNNKELPLLETVHELITLKETFHFLKANEFGYAVLIWFKNNKGVGFTEETAFLVEALVSSIRNLMFHHTMRAIGFSIASTS